MKRTQKAFTTALLLVVSNAVLRAQAPPESLRVPTTMHRPDEFGTGAYAVTVIPASSFTADTQARTLYGASFRDFGQDDDRNWYAGHFYSGVSVPSGAVIDFIGLQSYGEPGGNIATLFYVDRYSGTTSGIVSVASTAHQNLVGSDYNAAALGWQLVRNVHNALVLDVYIPGGSEHAGGLGWVEIWWKRSLSPGPASATFTDVPTTHPLFQFVEALHAAGITNGYPDGRFGVDDSITRGQMAVFLSSALGLHWPY